MRVDCESTLPFESRTLPNDGEATLLRKVACCTGSGRAIGQPLKKGLGCCPASEDLPEYALERTLVGLPMLAPLHQFQKELEVSLRGKSVQLSDEISSRFWNGRNLEAPSPPGVVCQGSGRLKVD